MSHRDIFPNFYGLPTNSWPREKLRELRELILHGTTRHRWLMLLLHRDSGDLLDVFERWQAWSNHARRVNHKVDTSRTYYAGDDYSRDLLRFVQSDYRTTAAYPHLIGTLVKVEEARLDLSEFKEFRRAPKATDFFAASRSMDLLPTVPTDTRIISVEADYKRLMRCLKRGGRLADIPHAQVALALVGARENIRVLQLSERSYELIRLCDGTRNVAQIANEFASFAPGGVSPVKASLYGLSSLAADGVIRVVNGRN